MFFWPNMAVKGAFCPYARFKLVASSVVPGFCHPCLRAKRPLLLRYAAKSGFKLVDPEERISLHKAQHGR